MRPAFSPYLLLCLVFALSSCRMIPELSRSATTDAKQPVHETAAHRRARKMTSARTEKRPPATTQESVPRPRPPLNDIDRTPAPNTDAPVESQPKPKSSPAPIDPIDDLPEVKPVSPPKMDAPPKSKPKPKSTDPVPGPEDLIGTIMIDEDNVNRILDAKGRDVEITGRNGTIVLSGGCGKLMVRGSGNQVQCDLVREIDISGDGNTLILGSVEKGQVSGSENTLSWGRGIGGTPPDIASSGRANVMKRLE